MPGMPEALSRIPQRRGSRGYYRILSVRKIRGQDYGPQAACRKARRPVDYTASKDVSPAPQPGGVRRGVSRSIRMTITRLGRDGLFGSEIASGNETNPILVGRLFPGRARAN